ncbi:MAG: GNAT family N-acetyltransferase [Candidatus Omnitrophica bacterium]|nr:GNAT family N-acetyltransferase [Candidatus Omnitrophota bacterium]
MERKLSKLLVLDEWDSRFFKKRIGKLKVTHTQKHLVSFSELLAVRARAKLENMNFVTVRFDKPDARLEKIARRGGLRKCGGGVNFIYKIPVNFKNAPSVDFKIKECTSQQISSACLLAKDAFRLSFLYSCGFAPQNVIDRYHQVWVRNLYANKNSCLLVASRQGNVLGFLVSSADIQGHRGKMMLMAVNKRYRGMGIGKRLVEGFIAWAAAHKISRIAVRTQEDNYAAIAVYNKLKFRLLYSDSDYYMRLK